MVQSPYLSAIQDGNVSSNPRSNSRCYRNVECMCHYRNIKVGTGSQSWYRNIFPLLNYSHLHNASEALDINHK